MLKKILLVDDEEDILRLVSSTLEGDERYAILVARDGIEALDVAKREKPDILFLDILMPRMDGHEVCRALKENPDTASIKVVMLTALTHEMDRDLARDNDADAYFTKPFSPTALIDKVDELLSQE